MEDLITRQYHHICWEAIGRDVTQSMRVKVDLPGTQTQPMALPGGAVCNHHRIAFYVDKKVILDIIEPLPLPVGWIHPGTKRNMQAPA
jgi:hypothetical protein